MVIKLFNLKFCKGPQLLFQQRQPPQPPQPLQQPQQQKTPKQQQHPLLDPRLRMTEASFNFMNMNSFFN